MFPTLLPNCKKKGIEINILQNSLVCNSKVAVKELNLNRFYKHTGVVNWSKMRWGYCSDTLLSFTFSWVSCLVTWKTKGGSGFKDSELWRRKIWREKKKQKTKDQILYHIKQLKVCSWPKWEMRDDKTIRHTTVLMNHYHIGKIMRSSRCHNLRYDLQRKKKRKKNLSIMIPSCIKITTNSSLVMVSNYLATQLYTNSATSSKLSKPMIWCK